MVARLGKPGDFRGGTARELGSSSLSLHEQRCALSEDDLRALSAGCQLVFDLVRDGQWHEAKNIRLAAGGGDHEASEGLRRLRELRKWFDVVKRPLGNRNFAYCIRPMA
jgi:hypothetical protein